MDKMMPILVIMVGEIVKFLLNNFERMWTYFFPRKRYIFRIQYRSSDLGNSGFILYIEKPSSDVVKNLYLTVKNPHQNDVKVSYFNNSFPENGETNAILPYEVNVFDKLDVKLEWVDEKEIHYIQSKHIEMRNIL